MESIELGLKIKSETSHHEFASESESAEKYTRVQISTEVDASLAV